MRLHERMTVLAAGWLLATAAVAAPPPAADGRAAEPAAAPDRIARAGTLPARGDRSEAMAPDRGPPPPLLVPPPPLMPPPPHAATSALPPGGPPQPYFLPPPALHALHDALALTPAQESLWQAAEEAMHALVHWRPEGREPPPAPQAIGGPPLRELARAADRDQDALTRALRTARDRWIDVDEALSAEQRAFVRGTMLAGHWSPPPPPPPEAVPGHRHDVAPGRHGAGPGP